MLPRWIETSDLQTRTKITRAKHGFGGKVLSQTPKNEPKNKDQNFTAKDFLFSNNQKLVNGTYYVGVKQNFLFSK